MMLRCRLLCALLVLPRSGGGHSSGGPPLPAAAGGLVDELSALAALRRAGDLDEREFRAAKQRLLRLPDADHPTPTAAAPQVVSPRDFGAVGDGTHDDTESLQAAIDHANNRSAALFLPSGLYVITRPINVRSSPTPPEPAPLRPPRVADPGIWLCVQVTAPVWGEGPSTSLIVNHGNGTDAFIVLTGYHSVFRDFKVQGDCDPNHPQANSCRTRDGIVLDVDKSYLRFENVHASFHGRHGLYQRASWATSWTNSSEPPPLLGPLTGVPCCPLLRFSSRCAAA